MQAVQDKLPEQLPLLPLKDIVVFPQMILPVFIAEDVCLKAVEAAMAKDKLILLSAFQIDGAVNAAQNADISKDSPELSATSPVPFDVYDVGTVAIVMRTRRLPDGRVKVLVQGVRKARITELSQQEPFPMVKVTAVTDSTANTTNGSEAEALMRTTREQLEKLVALGRALTPDILLLLEEVTDPGRLADLVASNMNLRIQDAQWILGTQGGLERLRRVHKLLVRELEVSSAQARIQTAAKEEVGRASREHYLREQLRAIRSELGELDGKDEMDELRDRVQRAQMSAEALSEATKQLKRLERMNQDSSEATITRTYIEWLVDLPWAKLSDTTFDIVRCKKVLEEDHFGLEKIKDRILEFIAVKKLNPDAKGPILCFVGPPGVGKTSLGRSIAGALGRKFVRLSLGGMRDEAEIRGHRRTYVGSQPGRLMQALKNVQVRNPVIMLDELDKLSSDYKGDPASALLEVLDPEQNHTFSDHYINVPFDLSQVMFIANANRLDTIPAPLRDRLEIIEVSGYSEDEKREIAKQYIIPKSIEQTGLTSDLVQIQDAAVELMINNYTRESGLRNLEKHIGAITRKIARNVAESDALGKSRKTWKVTPKVARELLGEERYISEEHDCNAQRIGVATGLAYTSVGGEILYIEVNLLPGKGTLTLTGHLGDVMKESAHAALSHIKSRSSQLGLDSKVFNETDVHLHFPAGAIPKDGPSAGVTIACALLSAFLRRPVRQDVAMTGELTLHGRVLPIGGLREKILAALRVGIKTVCVPEKNKSAVSELPASLRKRVEIRYVGEIDDLWNETLVGGFKATATVNGAEGVAVGGQVRLVAESVQQDTAH
ncbi:MAG: endopeptidase La [Pseudomonadota bacterium]|jgi:ATP-dependent Lon protease